MKELQTKTSESKTTENPKKTNDSTRTNDPIQKILKMLEDYDEDTPPRKNVMGTWGE